mmetsp:Transcript_30182/g.81102  ORF Transcript_30182/g.81102 Transcript_30182/m.81102 type:complete len:258 (+) Transcript_30182:338-1111(+)
MDHCPLPALARIVAGNGCHDPGRRPPSWRDVQAQAGAPVCEASLVRLAKPAHERRSVLRRELRELRQRRVLHLGRVLVNGLEARGHRARHQGHATDEEQARAWAALQSEVPGLLDELAQPRRAMDIMGCRLPVLGARLRARHGLAHPDDDVCAVVENEHTIWPQGHVHSGQRSVVREGPRCSAGRSGVRTHAEQDWLQEACAHARVCSSEGHGRGGALVCPRAQRAQRGRAARAVEPAHELRKRRGQREQPSVPPDA